MNALLPGETFDDSAKRMTASSDRPPAVEVLSAEKVFTNGTRGLAPIDLRIADGEFLTLIGPSGCGKSTIFNIVAGLQEPTRGRVVIDGVLVEDGSVLLVRRRNPPFAGAYALPGGFVDYGETVEAAAAREVQEETGLAVAVDRLVGVYSDPARDPRGHTVSVTFLVRRRGGTLLGADDADEARFFPLDALPALAFDHARILADARALLQG